MDNETLNCIMEILPKVIESQQPVLLQPEKEQNWYEKRKFFLENNQKLLEKVSLELEKNYHKECSTEEMFLMQKLYLLYSKRIPKKLLSLSWEHIKVILNIATEEKRKFYVDLCCKYLWDVTELQSFLMRDLYEKYILILQELHDYDEVTSLSFLEQLIKVESFIFEVA